ATGISAIITKEVCFFGDDVVSGIPFKDNTTTTHNIINAGIAFAITALVGHAIIATATATQIAHGQSTIRAVKINFLAVLSALRVPGKEYTRAFLTGKTDMAIGFAGHAIKLTTVGA